MAVSVDLPDTAVKIYANDWVATIMASPRADEHGFFHVYAHTVGSSLLKAEEAAVYVLNALAFGRTAFIRAKPESHTEKEFATDITHHRGYVRFSYKLETGIWHYPDPTMKIPSIGEAMTNG